MGKALYQLLGCDLAETKVSSPWTGCVCKNISEMVHDCTGSRWRHAMVTAVTHGVQ